MIPPFLFLSAGSRRDSPLDNRDGLFFAKHWSGRPRHPVPSRKYYTQNCREIEAAFTRLNDLCWEENEGVQFDVFDVNGHFVDRFFLKWSGKDIDVNRVGKTFTFSDGFVYFDDKTEDDLIVIRKGRLVGF